MTFDESTCFALTHKRDRPCGTSYHPCPLDEVKRTKKPATVELFHSDKEGKPRLFEIHGYPLFNKAGKVAQMAEYVLDITERVRAKQALRQNMEKYRRMVETVPLAVIVYDPQSRVLEWNEAARRIFGWNREEVLGKSVFDFLIPESETGGVREVFDTAKKKGTSHSHINKNFRKDGQKILCKWEDAILRDEHGEEVGVIAVAEDITEKIRLEEQLRQAQKLESVGILAGGIAHDFNNILTAILGNITLAKMSLKPEDELFERMTASASGLITDTAAFALRGSNIKCKISIPESLWPAEVDEGQISQVINNLIINAKQAMPDGGIIEVSVKNIVLMEKQTHSLKSGRYIKISIIDQGSGIPEDHLQKIFDPYFTSKVSGTGLGLATSYSIMKKHEGHITVESVGEKGTVFTLYLPASDGKAETRNEGRALHEVLEGPDDG